MKLDAQAPRRDAPRENRFEGAGRNQRSGQGGRRDSAPAADNQMAAAFAKLQGLRQ